MNSVLNRLQPVSALVVVVIGVIGSRVGFSVYNTILQVVLAFPHNSDIVVGRKNTCNIVLYKMNPHSETLAVVVLLHDCRTPK